MATYSQNPLINNPVQQFLTCLFAVCTSAVNSLLMFLCIVPQDVNLFLIDL